MDNTTNPIAQKLVESFVKVNKLNMKQHNIEGVRPNEFFMLIHIKKLAKEGMPGVKVSDLSKKLMVTPPTVTQVVTGLEKRGFVERSMDKEDRRAVRINLTDKGKCFMDRAYNNYMTAFNGLVNYLGEEKSINLIDLLSEVVVYFNDIKSKQNTL